MNITLTNMHYQDSEVLRDMTYGSISKELQLIESYETRGPDETDKEQEEWGFVLRECVDNLRSYERIFQSLVGTEIPDHKFEMHGYTRDIFDKYETLRFV